MSLSKASCLLFLGLTLVYLSLSPGTVRGMGYMPENITASHQILSNLGDWLSLRHAGTRVDWPRHGIVQLFFYIPFLLPGRLVPGQSWFWTDGPLALQPIVATALIGTVVFLWVWRLTSRLVWALVLAVALSFGTMLWPYAYIGLEPTQSLFLLLAGFLALGPRRSKAWGRVLLFGLICGLAVSVKSSGMVLLPAVAFLVFAYFRRRPGESAPPSPRSLGRILAVIILIAGFYGVNTYTRSLSPLWEFGVFTADPRYSVREPVLVLMNALGMLASANKGLLVYSPLLIVSLLSLGKAFREDSGVVVFALLVAAGLIGGCSLLSYWADETWGPRYLHSLVAPLVVCLGAARGKNPFSARREIPLIALAGCGVFVAFLGSAFYYGSVHFAAQITGQNTLESLQNDPNWNPIRFNLRLLGVWASGSPAGDPRNRWPLAPHWWFAPPADAPQPKTVDLFTYADPQPRALRFRGAARLAGLAFLAAGLFLLAGLARRAARSDRALPPVPGRLAAAGTGAGPRVL